MWFRSAWDWVRARRVTRFLGLTMFFVALMPYMSEHPVVLSRWSLRYALLMIVAGSLLGRAAWTIVTRPARDVSTAAQLVDGGVLVAGGGYLAAVMLSPAAAANLLHGNVFGTSLVVPALVAWASMALLSIGCAIAALQRVRGTLANICLVVVSCWMALVILEGIVRVQTIIWPHTLGFPSYSEDLWDARYVQRNRNGFRDAEHSPTATQDRRRILVVGDSFAFGLGVRRPEQRFGEKLASHLNRDSISWESVTVARSDSHTREEMAFLEHGLTYHPDIVVLLYVFNDVDYLHQIVPRSTVADPPQSLLGRASPARIAYKNSFLFQELYIRWRAVRSRQDDGNIEVDPYDDEDVMQVHLDDLRTFVDRAERAGARAFIVPFDPSVVHDEASAIRYEGFVRRLRGLAIPVIPVTSFGELSFDELTISRWDRHPNARAHDLAAATVSNDPVLLLR